MRIYPSFHTTYLARLCNLRVLASIPRRFLPPLCSMISSLCWCLVSKFLDLIFSKLDLLSSVGPGTTCATPSLSSTIQLPDVTGRVFFCHQRAGAWLPHVGAWTCCTGAWDLCVGALRPASPYCCNILGFFCCFYIILSYLGYCLFLGETFVSEFVLVPFFSVVPDSDFNSVFITSASFGWLLLIPSRGTDKLALICTSLAYEIALCGSLERTGSFVWLIS